MDKRYKEFGHMLKLVQNELSYSDLEALHLLEGQIESAETAMRQIPKQIEMILTLRMIVDDFIANGTFPDELSIPRYMKKELLAKRASYNMSEEPCAGCLDEIYQTFARQYVSRPKKFLFSDQGVDVRPRGLDMEEETYLFLQQAKLPDGLNLTKEDRAKITAIEQSFAGLLSQKRAADATLEACALTGGKEHMIAARHNLERTKKTLGVS